MQNKIIASSKVRNYAKHTYSGTMNLSISTLSKTLVISHRCQWRANVLWEAKKRSQSIQSSVWSLALPSPFLFL